MAEIENLDYTDKLIFIAEWYDFEKSFLKNFYLYYFPFDNTVELYDTDCNRVYLRRATCVGVSLKDMYLGNIVRIYGRQIKILDYGDKRTKALISKKNERTFLIFKPTVFRKLGELIDILGHHKFKVMKLKMCQLDRIQAYEFYEDKRADSFLPFMVEQLVSGPIVAFEVTGEDAIERWKRIMGPKDPAVARSEAPESLRAIYGKELASNGFHGADSEKEVKRETTFFFPQATDNRQAPKITAKFKNSTLCIIKPHIIEAGLLGGIITDITNNQFHITAIEMFYLSNANADELLEVYKGVIGDFNSLLLSYIDGPCVALEISGKEDCNVYLEFRKFIGPMDPDIARQIRPNTLRAKYGIDKYKNALHCTDLPEDTILELEYFFRILQD